MGREGLGLVASLYNLSKSHSNKLLAVLAHIYVPFKHADVVKAITSNRRQ